MEVEMKVEVIRELDTFQNGVLVKSEDGRYFVVSSVDAAFDTGQPETLVFEADENGDTDFHDVAGGTDVSREEAITELEGVLDGGSRSPRPGLFGALLDAFEGARDKDYEDSEFDDGTGE
jgi:hypothetical protein